MVSIEPIRVSAVLESFDCDPGPAAEPIGEPTRMVQIPAGFLARQQQRQAPGKTAVEIRHAELISTFPGAPAAACDEGRQLAITGAIGGQANEPRPIAQCEFSADNQREPDLFGCDVRPDHAGERAFVRQRECGVAELTRTPDQFRWVRGPLQKTEVGKTVKLGIVGRHKKPSCKNAVQEPISPADLLLEDPQLRPRFVARDEVIALHVEIVPPTRLDPFRAVEQRQRTCCPR